MGGAPPARQRTRQNYRSRRAPGGAAQGACAVGGGREDAAAQLRVCEVCGRRQIAPGIRSRRCPRRVTRSWVGWRAGGGSPSGGSRRRRRRIPINGAEAGPEA